MTPEIQFDAYAVLKAAAFVFALAVVAYGLVSLARHLDRERAARRRREANRTHVLVPFRPTTVRCLYAHDVPVGDATYSRDHGWLCVEHESMSEQEPA